MSQGPFALVDCNNFYVSCERVFQPHLERKPVMVLSNNDGCAVARSQEVKRLGIQMGAPLFEVRDLVEQHGIEVLSSNYALYGDMSQRVMKVASQFSPHCEVYSIDELFLDLSGFEHLDLEAYGRALQSKVRQWTGIPVSVGIGATKTLAKIANHCAKKNPFLCGVYHLDRDLDAVLKKMQVSEVWGIGPRWTQKLRALGIESAFDLARYDYRRIQQQFNVVLARTVLELQGLSCLPLEQVAPRKQIRVSRSFGSKVSDLKTMREALMNYTSRAAEKLRNQESRTQAVLVFLTTNPFNKKALQYKNSIAIQLPIETDDTVFLLKAALQGLNQIYRPGFVYKKVGVMLLDINREEPKQNDMFTQVDVFKRQKLMHVLDDCNQHFGRKTLHFAAQGFGRVWRMKQNQKSPDFTTDWNCLPKVR